MPITIEQARRARDQAIGMARTRQWPSVGIGIGQAQGSLAVKVNLSGDIIGEKPSRIDGVPVVYEIVGAIRML